MQFLLLLWPRDLYFCILTFTRDIREKMCSSSQNLSISTCCKNYNECSTNTLHGINKQLKALKISSLQSPSVPEVVKNIDWDHKNIFQCLVYYYVSAAKKFSSPYNESSSSTDRSSGMGVKFLRLFAVWLVTSDATSSAYSSIIYKKKFLLS